MTRRICTVFILALFCLSCFAGSAYAQEKQRKTPEISKEKIENAVQKAIRFLRSQQRSDGSWDYVDGPFTLKLPGVMEHMTQGCTALCLLAMLKGGIKPDDPAIKKGFSYCRSQSLEHVYSVACMVLALEALYTEPEPSDEKRAATELEKTRTLIAKDPDREFRRKASKRDKALMTELIRWLLMNQRANVWRYPQHGEDASNTQYVALAFSAARRMRIPIPPDSCKRMAAWLLRFQQNKGPEVPGFPVPAADHSIKDLKKIEEELRKQIGDIKKNLEEDKDKKRADEMTTTSVDEAREKLFAPEKHKMYARGWCYMPEDPLNQPWRKLVTGAMTTSGVIALTVAKAFLEGKSVYSSSMRKAVDKGIRDGCAWLARYFRTSGNPCFDPSDSQVGRTKHHYYYLYGLERAGMITLTPKFGEHDWYKEGAAYLVSQQQANGSWDGGKAGTSGPVPDTCFAILFLKKATKPIVNLPERPVTGGDLFGERGKK